MSPRLKRIFPANDADDETIIDISIPSPAVPSDGRIVNKNRRTVNKTLFQDFYSQRHLWMCV